MTISALPTPPSPLDTPAEFNTKAFNLLGALPDFVTEANALSNDVNAKSSTATSAASAASSSATSASNSATAAAASATSASNSATSASGSASSASSSAATALSEANRASAAAATVDLPAAYGNALKLLRQNSGATGLQYFDMIGAVSQSGGVPTGAIIERGSNANGEYVRFADGTQICTKVHSESLAIATAWGQWFMSSNTTPGAWAAEFSEAPKVSCTCGDATYYVATHAGGATTTSTGSFALFRGVSNAAATRQILITAVGRWF